MPRHAPVIRTTDLSKSYTTGRVTVDALRGVTLTVMPGEFVAVMGPSGSGKSTLLALLGLLERPTGGRYALAGEETTGLGERATARMRRERIGFVFQGFNLLPRATALANVELPLLYAGVPRIERRERAEAALGSVGLLERRAHRPAELSGGQQQRVAIARALVTRPAVILADEPTGNLDSRSEGEVLELLAAAHAAGATLVLVTHSAEVAGHGTRVVHVRDGLIESDSPVRRRG